MAERDFTLNLVTDDEVDTTRAAAQLDQLGQAADTTAAAQRDLADGADLAQGDLDRLAQAASGAGGDLDRLGATAGDAGSAVGAGLADGASRGSQAFGDMRDEAGAALMELAASFDGTMTGVLDAAQGAAPAIGAAFGPVGLAIGSAVGVGIGFARAQAEKLAEQITGLTDTLIADAGRIERDSVLAKVAQFASDGSIEKLADQARAAKVDVDDFTLAMAGDTAAVERTRSQLRDLGIDLDTFAMASQRGRDASMDLTQAEVDQLNAARRLNDQLDTQSDALSSAAERYDLYASAQEAASGSSEAAIAAQDALTAALDDAATGAADLAAAIDEGADAVEAALARQLQATANFEDNTTAVYDRLGQAGVDFAAAQGDRAAEAMQLLADAPADQGARIVAAWKKLGDRTGASVAAGIAASSPAAQAALTGIYSDLQRTADNQRPITVRVRVDPSGLNELQTMVRTGKVRQ